MLHVFATYPSKSMIFFRLIFSIRHLTLPCLFQTKRWNAAAAHWKGESNSAILNRREPIINQLPTKREVEGKKFFCFALLRQMASSVKSAESTCYVLKNCSILMWYWNTDHLPLNGSYLWISWGKISMFRSNIIAIIRIYLSYLWNVHCKLYFKST